MVLALLQREISNREMDRSMLIHRDSVPHDEDVEQGHRVSQSCMQPCPCALTRLLQPTHVRQQRQDGLYDHPHVPRAAFAHLLVGWIALFAVESAIGQHDRLVGKIVNQRPEHVVRCIGCRVVPRHNQPVLVDQVRQLGPNDPAVVG